MPNQSSPFVSVILPVYNCERFIKDAIISVLNQTFQNFELIIVNDGSTDETLKICKSFTDKRIKIINENNLGVSIARNNGITQSKGDYIAFIDSDDIWLSEKLEKQLVYLENYKEVGLSYCSTQFIDETGKLLKIYQIPKYKDITLEEMLCNNPIKNGSVPVLKRAALEEIKYKHENKDFYFDPDVTPAEDFDCWLRIFMKTSWKIEGLEDCLVYYRINKDGGSSKIERYYNYWKRVFEKNLSINPILFNKYSKIAESFLYRFLAQRIIWTRGNKWLALKIINKSIVTDYRIFTKDPINTIITFIGTYLYFLLPYYIYKKVEGLGFKIICIWQKKMRS